MFDEIKMHHATKAKAEKIVAMLAAEYPCVRLHAAFDDASHLTHWTVDFVQGPDDGDPETVLETEGKSVPEIADILVAVEEAGFDPEQAIEDEDDGPSGSVVPDEYRARYREASESGQSCGDWLANTLELQTHGADGFDVEAFTEVLVVNGVPFDGKWASLPESGQKGWVGRYRMNGRQMLEKIVAFSGQFKTLDGLTLTVPARDLAILQQKHAKAIAKAKKAAKDAEAAKAEAA